MDRGQAHTLEAFSAALLITASVIFALQATAVTPLSASTSNQHIQNQQRLMADDLLATAAENGTLRDAVVFWNTTEDAFANASAAGFFANGGPPNAFGRLLNDTFLDERIAFNVYVRFREEGGDDRETMVYMGSPSDNAVAVGRTVAIFNDTELTAPDASGNVSEAWTDDAFYAPDADRGGELFNVLEVRIVVWRM